VVYARDATDLGRPRTVHVMVGSQAAAVYLPIVMKQPQPTPTPTNPPTSTSTPIPPTATPTATSTATQPPTATATSRPPTATPTATQPQPPTLTPTPTSTVTPILMTTLFITNDNTNGISLVEIRNSSDNQLLLQCGPIDNNVAGFRCGQFITVASYTLIVTTNKCGRIQQRFTDATPGGTITRRVYCV